MQKNQKLLIVGNWKMNPMYVLEAKNRFKLIKKSAAVNLSLSIVVCPPFPFIEPLAALAKGSSKSNLFVGAQDVSFFDDGMSKTGEVGALMLESVGVSYAIVGHSERRAMGDTGQIISKKIQQALKTKLNIIVCFGEKERDTDGGYLEVIKAQLKEVLSGISKNNFHKIVLAYEPVWAIGRADNEALTSHDIHQMVIFIRKTLREMVGEEISSSIKILYGGSATPQNAEDIIHNGEVDGLLVGRASWQAESFAEIFKAVQGGIKAENKKALKETLKKAKNAKTHRNSKNTNPRISLKKKVLSRNSKKKK